MIYISTSIPNSTKIPQCIYLGASKQRLNNKEIVTKCLFRVEEMLLPLNTNSKYNTSSTFNQRPCNKMFGYLWAVELVNTFKCTWGF